MSEEWSKNPGKRSILPFLSSEKQYDICCSHLKSNSNYFIKAHYSAGHDLSGV